MNIFKKITTSPIDRFCTIQRPRARASIDLSSPATEIMTDFRLQPPPMLERKTSLEEARVQMTREHEVLKLVIDRQEHFKGVVSLADLLSLKGLKVAHAKGVGREDLTVADVMVTPNHLHAVSIHDLQNASIGDIVETLKKSGEIYILVIDPDANSICGIISADDLARRLPASVHITEKANSFADIYQALHY